jgi:hypothetical protein
MYYKLLSIERPPGPFRWRGGSLRPRVVKSLARAHPFLSENERMDGEKSTEPIEFLGLRGRFYLNAERLYRLDEAGNPRLVRLVGTAACRMLRKLLEHKGTWVSAKELIREGWESSAGKTVTISGQQ